MAKVCFLVTVEDLAQTEVNAEKKARQIKTEISNSRISSW